MAGPIEPTPQAEPARSWTIPLAVDTSGLDVVLGIVVTLVNEYGAIVEDVDVRNSGGTITLLLDADSFKDGRVPG